MASISITVERSDQSPILPQATGFTYVDQGNFQTLKLERGSPISIYSDSATSCIITIVVADFEDCSTVTLAHLDSPSCIEAFFTYVSSLNAQAYRVFAQGANPVENATSISNAKQLKASVASLGSLVTEQALFLLEGDPREDNRGEFGLSFDGSGNALVSNQPYTLALYQRDPSCGGQTVYCIMRRQEKPPVQIRNAGLPFTHPELVELASIALQYRKDQSDPATAFTNIVNLQSDEILNSWSTTPEYEAPWFSDQLKLGAAFAIAMAPVVTLSELYLLKAHSPTFSRLKQALFN